ncbi:MAG: hypothetical protein ABIP51_11165 [Bacteroidia bacterium]
MKTIDDTVCIEKINELFVPIAEWFDTDELQEKYEQNSYTPEEIKSQFDRLKLAISQEKEIIQYITILSYNYPNKDLMLLVLKELYNYLKNYPNYSSSINQWGICQYFKKYIKYGK